MSDLFDLVGTDQPTYRIDHPYAHFGFDGSCRVITCLICEREEDDTFIENRIGDPLCQSPLGDHRCGFRDYHECEGL